jgi:hypothetical protein
VPEYVMPAQKVWIWHCRLHVRDEEKEAKDAEKRLDEFGDWLENQELPEEFELRVGEEE